ncbi:tRNA (N6-threonylcarbamoyladenosine(37)-N6)-methyltransferase TrmO [[Eubacterium] cellulosolvens]
MIVAPIGVIHTPYAIMEKVPIQPCYSDQVGEVEVFKEYEEGLKDIEGFSHILIFYLFHKSQRYSLLVKPFLDSDRHGVFATRHPNRPNPIGMSLVRLVERKGGVLRVEGIDVLDGTPLIDIKPYVPSFDLDQRADVKIGWLEGRV